MLVTPAIIADARAVVGAATRPSGFGDGILNCAVIQPAGIAPVQPPLPGLKQLIKVGDHGTLVETGLHGIMVVHSVAAHTGIVWEHNTIAEATLHLQENLLHGVFHPIDDLTAVFSCVFLGDIGYQNGGIITVVLMQIDAVLKASVGPLVESHGRQHILIQSLILCYLGPFDSDANATKNIAVLGWHMAGQSDIGT